MLAGIPGTGISVFFYLLSVCGILLLELVNSARRRRDSAKRRVAWLQLKILVGAALTVGLTTWGYGYLISEFAGVLLPAISPLVGFHLPFHAALIGPGVMLGVILSVEIASLVCRRRADQTSAARESAAPAIHKQQGRIATIKFADE